MDVEKNALPRTGGERAVHFSGTWQEFLPIALVNLLLTIFTLGIYRFWAQARVRRYLWSRTRLVGSDLEWTGTGGEMFIGFLMVMGILLGIGAVIFGGAALLGDWFIVVGVIAFYIFILWAIGFAQFRALRYRLSRTYWRGIRGGSDESGVGYGWSAFGNNFVAGLTFGILTPRAIVYNWNDRMRAMSFGPHLLDSNVDTHGLQWRWMMLYVVYFGTIILAVATTFAFAGPNATDDQLGVVTIIVSVAMFALIGLILISFWALFFRKVADTFGMGNLTAEFPVSTFDWIKFYAKLIGLTIITLGFGSLMWSYFRWKFVIDRLHLYGEVDLDELTQSTTRAPRDAEGFADAFDIGAF